MKKITLTFIVILVGLFLVAEPTLAQDFVGEVTLPPYLERFSSECGTGLITIFNLILRLVIIGAGFFALWQFVMAGYGFISSSGDQQAIADARNKIIMTIVGLLIIASALVLTGIIGQIFYGNWNAIIAPSISGVGECPGA